LSSLGLGMSDIAFGKLSAFTEEDLLALLHQELERSWIGRVQAILVDQHLLMLAPKLPRVGGHLFVDALAERAGKRAALYAGERLAKLHALDGALRVCEAAQPTHRRGG